MKLDIRELLVFTMKPFGVVKEAGDAVGLCYSFVFTDPKLIICCFSTIRTLHLDD